MTTSYMQMMHNRHRVAPRHKPVQPFFPTYTLPAVAKLAGAPKDNPPAFIPGTNVPAMGASMPLGSYYQSTPGYYRNPVPYLASDVGAPVPGWGVNPLVAGPPKLGVGATLGQRIATNTAKAKIDLTKFARFAQAQRSPSLSPSADPSAPSPTPASSDPDKIMGLPWWALPAGAAVLLVGVGYFGTTKGWF